VIAQTDANGITLLLTGTLNAACVADVEAALDAAHRLRAPVAFDFSRVRLIDRPMLRYLVDAMEHGIRIVNCPEHVARWMRQESSAQV
jgi:anti-anti-sigma regulatory factor